PVADRALPQARCSLPLPRLLDRAKPQDGLQDPVPADAGTDRRSLAGGHPAKESVSREWRVVSRHPSLTAVLFLLPAISLSERPLTTHFSRFRHSPSPCGY